MCRLAPAVSGMTRIDLFCEPDMPPINRITRDAAVMGGKPCIRGLRVTVGTIVGLLATKHSQEDILAAYPYLEPDDIQAALSCASAGLVRKFDPVRAADHAEALAGGVVAGLDEAAARVRLSPLP